MAQSTHATGESRKRDGPVSGRTVGRPLDVEDGVDGGQEAEEGPLAGIGDGKFVPEKGN